jgi:hypothetical protein
MPSCAACTRQLTARAPTTCPNHVSHARYADHFDRRELPEATRGGEPLLMYDGGGSEYTIGAPRARIFRRDQATVVDIPSYKRLLRCVGESLNIPDGAMDPSTASSIQATFSNIPTNLLLVFTPCSVPLLRIYLPDAPLQLRQLQ